MSYHRSNFNHRLHCSKSYLQHLRPIFFIRFDFFTSTHWNWMFHDNIRMTGLFSVLDGEAKGNVEPISCNKIFYPTA